MTHQVIHVDAFAQHGTAIICSDETVWITVALRWWDLATLLWWWLCPAHRKAWIVLTTTDKHKVRSRAVCVARRHIRIGRSPA